MNDKSDRLIGVDIGKRFLDVAREGVRAVRRHSNDAVEIARFVGGLEAEHDIVIFERSGGYERLLEAQLAAAGIRWAVVHSRRVKAFRVAKGIKAKTDAIDCRLLRDFGRDRLNEGQLRFGRLETSRWLPWSRGDGSSMGFCMTSVAGARPLPLMWCRHRSPERSLRWSESWRRSRPRSTAISLPMRSSR